MGRILCKILLFLTLTCGCVFGYNLNVESALTFKDPSVTKSRGSYFGFTVVLINNTHTGSWLLVGAPRANSTGKKHRDIVEPGVLFKCRVNNVEQICEQHILDNEANATSGCISGTNYERKDGAWISGAMDIYSSGDEAEVTTCGPRGVHEYEIGNQPDRYMLGICYVIKAKDLNETDIPSIKKIMVPYISGIDMGYEKLSSGNYTFYYVLAQAGLSVHYAMQPNKETMLVAGAPGVLNWRGTVLYAARKRKYHLVPQNQLRGDVQTCETESFINISRKNLKKFDLFGYQVNSGKFFKDTYSYVASAPRANNMAGKVLVFSISEKISPHTLKGSQTGEYYGASMAVANVNGDDFHDLIIGAPLFDEKFEEGRIYVYYGTKTQNLFKHGDPVNGNSERSRFGAAITSLGDIDHDGYEDIAVGAPYEGNGAVYIFSGSSGGLRKDYSQRIVAKDSWPNLKGFGISISKPSDIDNNHYNDIAVGSFLSGNAVVLRSHPVVKLYVSLTSNTKFILLNASSFTVQLDLWFEGQYVDEVDVDFNVTLDKKYTQGKISTGSPHQAVITYKNIVTLKSGGNHTEKLTVYLDQIKFKSSNEGFRTMIVMAASLYKNDSTETVNGVDFTKLLPVLHKYDSKKSTSLSIPISPGCGEGICYCDLELTVYLKQLRDDDTFVTGSVKVLDLEITVLNKVDTAYQTTVCIILPDPVQLDSLPKNCYEPKTGNITCAVAYMLRQDMKDSFTVQLDVTRASHDFNISISVSSIIDDMDLSNNFKSKMIRLVTDADVTISGKDENPQHSYNNRYPETAQITHKYEVQKFKDSSVDEVEVTLNVPWFYYVEGQIEPVSIVKSYGIQTYQNDDRYYDELTCVPNISESEKGILDESNFDEDPGKNNHSVDESSVNNFRKKRGLIAINSAVYLNCTNLSNNTMCRVIKCSTRPFTQKNIIVRITLTMEINLAHLASYVGKNGEIRFFTHGSVNITKPALQQLDGVNKLTDNATVETVFNLYTEQEKVETKIYIIAIIVGLLLVLLLLLGLIKVGFFRRKQQEEMKSLLADNAAEAPIVEENDDNHVFNLPEP